MKSNNERWCVVQKYYSSGNQHGTLKKYEHLTDEERELLKNNKYKEYDKYELKVDEFPTYEYARDFKNGM